MIELAFAGIGRLFEVAKNTGLAEFAAGSEFVCARLMAHMGDIAIFPDWAGRAAALGEMFAGVPEFPSELVETYPEQMSRVCRSLENIPQGETVRIWHCDTPEDTCGFYWALDLLENFEGSIISVDAPLFFPFEDRCEVLRALHEYSVQNLAEAAGTGREVTRAEKFSRALLWRGLQKANSPLRAVISGLPVSVPEDFYDYLLRGRQLPQTEDILRASFNAASAGPVGADYFWYARRIRQMLGEKTG